MPNNYRTLFKGTLSQGSDMCSSGTDAISPIDMLPARDGKGRLVIRGTTLAGAMQHTARKLGYAIPESVAADPNKKPKSGEQSESDKDCIPSHWITYNSYPEGDQTPLTQLRQYVKIDPATGAAEDHALFDMEVVVRGTQWSFLLEVKTDQDLHHSGPTPEQLALAVLNAWQTQGVFIGRRAVAGTGWMQLTELSCLRLSDEAAAHWPDNSQPPAQLFDALAAAPQPGISLIDSQQLAAEFSQLPAPSETQTLRRCYRIRLTPGLYQPEPEGEIWGLDGLFIGGHAAEMPFSLDEDLFDNGPWRDHFYQPEGFQLSDQQDMPDHFFAYNQQGQPYIPGSSIRGVLQHQIRRNLTGDSEREAKLTQLFGSTEHSSQLYVGDAQLSQGSDWQGMIMHNHTEDEFTAGVYGSNKFVRCAVVSGEFCCHIILEHQDPAQLNQQEELLLKALKMGKQRQLPIGGKQWVDSGWIKWDVECLTQAEEAE